VDFLGFVVKWKNWMLFGFIFLFRWFFGLIRPWFCYVTFLKIPYSLRKFLQFFMIFLGIFSGKKPSWYPHGDLWFSFFCFMCSNFWFIPIMIFSLLQIFLTCFSSPYCYLSKDFFFYLKANFLVSLVEDSMSCLYDRYCHLLLDSFYFKVNIRSFSEFFFLVLSR
jgi:hypothetical protein